MSPTDAVHHPLFARVYARCSRAAEDRGQADHRRRLLAAVRGRVVEVGAGNGLNFAHYPPEVDEVVAVEPEAHLRSLAEEAAARAQVAVTVVDGAASRLPVDDASCDAAVASLVLCTVPDQALALAELRRVLRSGGELRFYEHVVAQDRRMARLQHAADATFWPRVAGGCHAARDTGAAIAEAGFAVERQERFAFRPSAIMPAVPHILGVARNP
ncbi:MAG: class I SAM-dependent methyltransferase [Solirubrobacteraceae bacterium]